MGNEIAKGGATKDLDDLIDEGPGEDVDLGLNVGHRAAMLRSSIGRQLPLMAFGPQASGSRPSTRSAGASAESDAGRDERGDARKHDHGGQNGVSVDEAPKAVRNSLH